uniref:Uncharacterized protein n=1 Tax=Trichogramma kaykai TaxID=54128 RepID=A0ABD2X463_9HYME
MKHQARLHYNLTYNTCIIHPRARKLGKTGSSACINHKRMIKSKINTQIEKQRLSGGSVFVNMQLPLRIICVFFACISSRSDVAFATLLACGAFHAKKIVSLPEDDRCTSLIRIATFTSSSLSSFVVMYPD